VAERTATLREQANLLNVTHDGMFVREMNNLITFWNRGAEELYGFKAEQAVGRSATNCCKRYFRLHLTRSRRTC
jgi:PAS domain S-box-containing protein